MSEPFDAEQAFRDGMTLNEIERRERGVFDGLVALIPDGDPYDDDGDDFDEDACPKCERSNCSWEAGICVCHHCGYIGS